jgi:putative transposase
MSRKLRIHYASAVYHVILRGNDGGPVFFDDRDRLRFYLYLQEMVERFQCRIHGFCCMTNHIHLVVQVADIPLSRIMQSLSLRYTRWINFRRHRTGHLFQGRYKAIMVDADAYLLELVRYIHLNPVRASVTNSPDYPWSGHRAYMGKEILPWLTTGWVLSQFSVESSAAREGYQRFIAEGIDGERRSEFHSGLCEGRILGDDRFADDAMQRANQHRTCHWTLPEMIGTVCRLCGITRDELTAPGKMHPYSEARAVAAMLVQESPHHFLTELGKLLQRDLAALGKAAQRMRRQAVFDERLAAMLKKLRKELDLCQMSECQA